MKKEPFERNTLTELTPEQVEAFKQQYGGVFMFLSEDKNKKCFLHTPDRVTLDAAEAISSQTKKGSKYSETIIKNCWLAGDKEMVTEDSYFYGLSKHIGKLVEVKEVELEKL